LCNDRLAELGLSPYVENYNQLQALSSKSESLKIDQTFRLWLPIIQQLETITSELEELANCKHFLRYTLHQNEHFCHSGFFYQLFGYFGLIGCFISVLAIFLVSMALNNYQMQAAQEEEENASKVQISIPNHIEEGPREVKIPPSKRSNPAGVGNSVAETDVERTHTIRHGTDTSMTPPKMISPK